MWDMWDNTIVVFLIVVGSTWRLSYMLVYEEGPLHLFVFLREMAGITHDDDFYPISYSDNFFAELLSCMYCTSVWVGIFITIFVVAVPDPYNALILLPLSLSAGAILIDSMVQKE